MASVVLLLLLLGTWLRHDAYAGTLADVFSEPRFRRLGLAPVGQALAATVAGTYPIASASSSLIYRYDPAVDTMRRIPAAAGPIIGERAETIGGGALALTLSVSHVDLDTIDGEELHALQSRRRVDGRFLFFPVPGGITLRNGRYTDLLPVSTVADIDVQAQQVLVGATYGVTPSLDVNLTIPIVATSLDLRTTTQVPDPRYPQFALPEGDPRAGTVVDSASGDSVGIGDLLLRTKYLVTRRLPLDLATTFAMSLPSGSTGDFHGRGAVHLFPGLAASRLLAERVEPLLNVGLDLDTEAVDRSAFTWAAGVIVQVIDPLAVMTVFLGRNDFGPPADPIAVPFFFQIERADTYDASVGVRWRPFAAAVVSANVIVPMNQQGLRPEPIPTLAFEWSF